MNKEELYKEALRVFCGDEILDALNEHGINFLVPGGSIQEGVIYVQKVVQIGAITKELGALASKFFQMISSYLTCAVNAVTASGGVVCSLEKYSMTALFPNSVDPGLVDKIAGIYKESSEALREACKVHLGDTDLSGLSAGLHLGHVVKANFQPSTAGVAMGESTLKTITSTATWGTAIFDLSVLASWKDTITSLRLDTGLSSSPVHQLWIDAIYVGNGDTDPDLVDWKVSIEVNGAVVAERGPGGVNYLVSDHLGSVLARTDEAGTIVSSTRYRPFGTMVNAAVVPDQRSFTGQRWDSENSLYYYNARYYDPQLGRFTQPDPALWDGQLYGSVSLTLEEKVNPYLYAMNNPVVYTDPTGLEQVEVATGVWVDTDAKTYSVATTESTDTGTTTTAKVYDYGGATTELTSNVTVTKTDTANKTFSVTQSSNAGSKTTTHDSSANPWSPPKPPTYGFTWDLAWEKWGLSFGVIGAALGAKTPGKLYASVQVPFVQLEAGMDFSQMKPYLEPDLGLSLMVGPLSLNWSATIMTKEFFSQVGDVR